MSSLVCLLPILNITVPKLLLISAPESISSPFFPSIVNRITILPVVSLNPQSDSQLLFFLSISHLFISKPFGFTFKMYLKPDNFSPPLPLYPGLHRHTLSIGGLPPGQPASTFASLLSSPHNSQMIF